MNITEFKDWYETAKPREHVVYHRGYLPNDKEIVKGGCLPACNDVADHAWVLCENGRIQLVQRKHGKFDYDYIAIRNKR